MGFEADVFSNSRRIQLFTVDYLRIFAHFSVNSLPFLPKFLLACECVMGVITSLLFFYKHKVGIK